MVSGKCGFEFLSATFDFVTLGKLLNLSELPFYRLQNGDNFYMWGGLSVVIYVEISSIAVSGIWEVLKKMGLLLLFISQRKPGQYEGMLPGHPQYDFNLQNLVNRPLVCCVMLC